MRYKTLHTVKFENIYIQVVVDSEGDIENPVIKFITPTDRRFYLIVRDNMEDIINIIKNDDTFIVRESDYYLEKSINFYKTE